MKPLHYLAALAVPVSLTAGVIYSNEAVSMNRRHCEMGFALVKTPLFASGTIHNMGSVWWISAWLHPDIKGDYRSRCNRFSL